MKELAGHHISMHPRLLSFVVVEISNLGDAVLRAQFQLVGGAYYNHWPLGLEADDRVPFKAVVLSIIASSVSVVLEIC